MAFKFNVFKNVFDVVRSFSELDARYYTQSQVDDLIAVENLWDRIIATSTLTPHTANDNVDLGSGNFTTTGVGTFDSIDVTAEVKGGHGNFSFITDSSDVTMIDLDNGQLGSGGTPWGVLYASVVSVNYIDASVGVLSDLYQDQSGDYTLGTLNGTVWDLPAVGDITATGTITSPLFQGAVPVSGVRSAKLEQDGDDLKLWLDAGTGSVLASMTFDYTSGDTEFTNAMNGYYMFDGHITAVGTILGGTITDGTLTITGGDLSTTGTVTMGSASAIKGTATGASNLAWLGFEDVNGVRKGYVGDSSSETSDIVLSSDSGGVKLKGNQINLQPSGGVTRLSSTALQELRLQDTDANTDASVANFVAFYGQTNRAGFFGFESVGNTNFDILNEVGILRLGGGQVLGSFTPQLTLSNAGGVDAGAYAITTTGLGTFRDLLVAYADEEIGSGTMNSDYSGGYIDFNDDLVPDPVPEESFPTPYLYYITWSSGAESGNSFDIKLADSLASWNSLDYFELDGYTEDDAADGDTFDVYRRPTATIDTMQIMGGSITDTSGAINFGNESLTTTGPITGSSLRDGTMIISSGSISNGVNATFSGTVQAEHLYSTDDAMIDDDLRADGQFSMNVAPIANHLVDLRMDSTDVKGIYLEQSTNDYSVSGSGLSYGLHIIRHIDVGTGEISNPYGIHTTVKHISSNAKLVTNSKGLFVAVFKADNDGKRTNELAVNRTIYDNAFWLTLDDDGSYDTTGIGNITHRQWGSQVKINNDATYADTGGVSAPDSRVETIGYNIDMDILPVLDVGDPATLTVLNRGILINIVGNNVGTSTNTGIRIATITGADTNWGIWDGSGADWALDGDSQYIIFGEGQDGKIGHTGSGLEVISDLITATNHLLLRGGTNGIDFNIGATEQISLIDGVLQPTTTNDIDLGTSSLLFKDLWLINKAQFRDSAIGIYSQADTFLDIFADGGIRIGDSSAGAPTNYLNISPTGVVTLVGSAKRDLTLRADLDYTIITAQGKPTQAIIGVIHGYSMPIYNNDNEELFFNENVPGRWDGASDIKFHVLVALELAETADETFKFQLSWNQVGETDVVPATTHDTTDEITVVDGTQYATYMLEFTIDYDADAGDAIIPHDDLAGRLRRVASAGDEVDGEIIVLDWHTHYTVDKMFKAPE